MLSEEDRAKIAPYPPIRDNWLMMTRFWRVIHISLGVVAIALSAIVANRNSDLLAARDYNIIAILLVIITGLITFLNAQGLANKYRRAWVVLNSVIVQYEVDHHTTPEDVIHAHEYGESILYSELQLPSKPPKAPRTPVQR
jgi:fatty acid desaturase